MSKTARTSSERRINTASLIGIKARDTSALIESVQRGLPVAALATLGKTTGLTSEQVRDGIGMSERTLARRRKKADKLSSEESDRVVRISRVFALAIELFEGDTEAARRWFLASNRALNGETPLQFVKTEIGAREVENLIGRLEHGVFS